MLRSTLFLFICSKISVSQCEKFGPLKGECRVLTERFFGYARWKKRKFLLAALEMVFVESSSLIWPMYMALWSKPLTEWHYRVIPHDFKNVYNYPA